jgi:hypothetical protein
VKPRPLAWTGNVGAASGHKTEGQALTRDLLARLDAAISPYFQ